MNMKLPAFACMIACVCLGGEIDLGALSKSWDAFSGRDRDAVATCVLSNETVSGRLAARLEYEISGSNMHGHVGLQGRFKPIKRFQSLKCDLLTPGVKEIYVRFMDDTRKTFACKFDVNPDGQWHSYELSFESRKPGTDVISWGGVGDDAKDRPFSGVLASAQICIHQFGLERPGPGKRAFAMARMVAEYDDSFPSWAQRATKYTVLKTVDFTDPGWALHLNNHVKGSNVTAKMTKKTVVDGKDCAKIDYQLTGSSPETFVSWSINLPKLQPFKGVRAELYSPGVDEWYVRFTDQDGITFAYKYAMLPDEGWQVATFTFDNPIPGHRVFCWGIPGAGELKRTWNGGISKLEFCIRQADLVEDRQAPRLIAFREVEILTE